MTSETPPAAPPPAPSPPPPTTPPAEGALARALGWIKARNDATQARWDDVLHIPRVRRYRLLAKVIAIHARYVCGYMMTGFLVSAPISLGMAQDAPSVILASFVLGGLFAVPFVVLIPFTRIDWARMRLPEFKNLELGLIKWATAASFAFLLFTLFVRLLVRSPQLTTLEWLCDPHIARVNLVLMGFAWLRIWFEHWMFRDFYRLHPQDDTLVLFRVPPDESRSDAKAPSGSSPSPNPPENPGHGVVGSDPTAR